MMRHFVVAGLMVAVLGTGALAAENGRVPDHQQMPMMRGAMMGRMMGGPMMPMMRGGMGPMMASGKIAAWDGDVYLLRDGRLVKLNHHLDVVASVELPRAEMPMMEHGMTGRRGAPPEQMPPGMEMRCKAMMRADIQAGDPQALLALKDELKLTPDQVSKLQTIARTAGAGARDVLTDDQKAKARQMEETPPSMMEMEGPMRWRMMQMMGGAPQHPRGGGMGMGRGGMMNQEDPPAARHGHGGMGMGGMQQMAMMQGPPPEMAMRCTVMMRTQLDAYAPQALLALKEELKLTPDQVSKLQTIADTARAGAEEVLTPGQRAALKGLQKTPTSMMKMHGPMHEMMMRMMGGGRMAGMMPGGMMMYEDQVAADGKGVYVLAGGRLIVYNHDLKEERSKALPEITPREHGG